MSKDLLVTLTTDEYVELHKSICAELIDQVLQAKQSNQSIGPESDIIFLNEALKMTGYKKTTLYSKASRGEIPVLSRRRPLSFSRKALLQWIQDGKPSVAQMKASAYLNRRK